MMVVKSPCGICQKAVGKKHNAICCDLCNKWIHIACNNLDKKTYRGLQGSTMKWFCLTCIKQEIPFTSQTNLELERVLSGKHIIPFKTKEIQNFTNQINTRINDDMDIKNTTECLYYEVNDLKNLQSNNENSFSLMHLNISSLQYHFDELNELLEKADIKFSIIGITESRH